MRHNMYQLIKPNMSNMNMMKIAHLRYLRDHISNILQAATLKDVQSHIIDLHLQMEQLRFTQSFIVMQKLI